MLYDNNCYEYVYVNTIIRVWFTSDCITVNIQMGELRLRTKIIK